MDSAMRMRNHEIELDAMEEEYGDEILSTGWNPDVNLVCQELQLMSASAQITAPGDPATVISEMLLRRMYSYHH